MIPLDEARDAVVDACPVAPAARVPLVAATGCVAAVDVVAEVAVPPFSNSAMDGFALRAADTGAVPTVLRVVGRTMAGDPPASIGPGEAIRIMTGAPLPRGADAVCMQEEAAETATAGTVTVGSCPPGAFVRLAGDDLVPGQRVLLAGAVVNPGHVGLLAGLGRESVDVHPRPRVGVLSTGDELVEPPQALGPGQIRDANRPALLALLGADGFPTVDLGRVADDEPALCAVLADAAASCDAIVVSGGVSVGEADLVAGALDRICSGAASWFQVAIRPAKPFAFGVIDATTPVFAVPGNPVSAQVSYALLVRPALRTMAGHRDAWPPLVPAITDVALGHPPDGKTHFVRVRAGWDGDGRLHARPTGIQQSHVLNALAAANALAAVPDGPGIAVGETVELVLLDPASVRDGVAGVAIAVVTGADAKDSC